MRSRARLYATLAIAVAAVFAFAAHEVSIARRRAYLPTTHVSCHAGESLNYVITAAGSEFWYCSGPITRRSK